jgi:pimeloyl-ACP methyl ester carboxylesterase
MAAGDRAKTDAAGKAPSAAPPTAIPAVKELAGLLPCKVDFFDVAGCPAFLIRPKEAPAASPAPWVWCAPVIGHPNASHSWMLRQWLAKGIGMAGVDVGESCGSPRGRAVYTAFWKTLGTRYRMSECPCLLPQSRGGLMVYNWAAENPTRVACIAGIYTVCDLRSYPGLENACGAYGLSAAALEARLAEHNPIDRLALLAKAGVPILHVHGDADKVVPLEKNSGELARRYRALGGPMRLVVIPGKGHQVCPEFFECQELVDFVIAHATRPRVPGVVIDHSPKSSGIYVGSPSIAILPNGDYVASHDQFGPKSTEHKRAVTRVFRSADKGQTWKPAADIDGQFWSTLFVHRGELYLLGTLAHYSNAVIRRSADGGRTWTEPKDANSGLLSVGRYHCAPVPVVLHQGRLWRAMEETSNPSRWGLPFRAMMMSAPVEADLLRAESWNCTNRLGGDASWLGGKFNGWLEGNAVVTPEGRIVDILRVDCPEGGKAAVVEVSEDGRSVSFDPATGVVDFPGGAKKFTIRYDAPSKRYWSLTNYVPPKYRGLRAGGVRNTLALTSSSDLRTWKVNCILLYHPDVRKHAFQYPDWQFDGEDIIAAIRTAYDDGLGGAHNAHDANYLTFHRFRNFRRLTLADSVIDPKELAAK